MSRFLRYQKLKADARQSGLHVAPTDKRIAMLAALLEPYYGFTYENKKKKDKNCPLSYHIIAESLKVSRYSFRCLINSNHLQLSNKDCEEVFTILDGSHKLRTFVHREEKDLNRKEIGTFLK